MASPCCAFWRVKDGWCDEEGSKLRKEAVFPVDLERGGYAGDAECVAGTPRMQSGSVQLRLKVG